MSDHCKMGARCQAKNCRLRHDCLHKGKCFNFHCKLSHPPTRIKPCRLGSSCDNPKECVFLHPKPKKQKEKLAKEIQIPCQEGNSCIYYQCQFSHMATSSPQETDKVKQEKERPGKCDLSSDHDAYCKLLHHDYGSLYSFIRANSKGGDAAGELVDIVRTTLLAHMRKELKARKRGSSIRNMRVFATTDSQRIVCDENLKACDDSLHVIHSQLKQYEAFVSDLVPELMYRTSPQGKSIPIDGLTVSQDVKELIIRASYKLRPFTLDEKTSTRNYTEPLPILASRVDLCKIISENEIFCNDKKLVLLIKGDTGSGKSTQIPLYLSDYYHSREVSLPVVCTQPNDLATKSIASRVKLEHCAGGQIQSRDLQDIGYKITGKSKLGTAINFYSEEEFFYEILELVRDGIQLNTKYACVVIDDAQQRSKFTDAIIGLLCCYALKERRMPIIISSSGQTQLYEKLSLPHCLAKHWKSLLSQDSLAPRQHRYYDIISEFLEEMKRSYSQSGALPEQVEYSRLRTKASNLLEVLLPAREELRNYEITFPAVSKLERLGLINLRCLELKGRPFPVTVQYPQIETTPKNYLKEAVRYAVKLSAVPASGDILVFLSSRQEIERASRIIREKYSKDIARSGVYVCQLYEGQTSKEQLPVLTLSVQRKIIFATSIAETSLTIPRVRSVVDTGYEMSTCFDRRLRTDYQRKIKISRNSSDQRMGRAGRTAPGVCYRLYPKDDYETRPRDKSPEILQCGLDSLFITLNCYRLWDTFFWLKPPSDFDTKLTKEYLYAIGALFSHTGRTENTPFGKFLAMMRVPIRVGKLLYLSVFEKGGYKISAGLSLASIVSLSDLDWWNFSAYEYSPTIKLEHALLKLGFENASDIVFEGVIVALYYIYTRWESIGESCEKLSNQQFRSIFGEIPLPDAPEIHTENEVVSVFQESTVNLPVSGCVLVFDDIMHIHTVHEPLRIPENLPELVVMDEVDVRYPGNVPNIKSQETIEPDTILECLPDLGTMIPCQNLSKYHCITDDSHFGVSFKGGEEMTLGRKKCLQNWLESQLESCLRPGILKRISFERQKLVNSLQHTPLPEELHIPMLFGELDVDIPLSELKGLLLGTFFVNAATRNNDKIPLEYHCKYQSRLRGMITPYIPETGNGDDSFEQDYPAELDEDILSYAGSCDDFISSWFQSHTEVELRFSEPLENCSYSITSELMFTPARSYLFSHKISGWYTELALGASGTQTVIRLIKSSPMPWTRLLLSSSNDNSTSCSTESLAYNWKSSALLHYRNVCYTSASIEYQFDNGIGAGCSGDDEYYSYGFGKVIPFHHKETEKLSHLILCKNYTEHFLAFPPVLCSNPKFSITHLEPSVGAHMNIIPRQAGSSTRIALLDDTNSKKLDILRGKISSFVNTLQERTKDIFLDDICCSFGPGLELNSISDGTVHEQDYKLCLNIHWSEGKRKGNGIIVYPNTEQGMSVMDSYQKKLSQENGSPKNSWVLRLPKKFQRKLKNNVPGGSDQRSDETTFILSVSSLAPNVTEIDVKDFLREWGVCKSIIFFRDVLPCTPSQHEALGYLRDNFVLPLEKEWNAIQPIKCQHKDLFVEPLPLTSALTRSISCSIGPVGRSLNMEDILLGLKYVNTVNEGRDFLINDEPLVAELEFVKVLVIHREVSTFFRGYLDSIIETALHDKVEVIRLPPKLGGEDFDTYQFKVLYDSADMKINLKIEENRVNVLKKFSLVCRTYNHHRIAILFSRCGRRELHKLIAKKIRQGYSQSGFIFVEKRTVKLYALREKDILECVSQLDQLLSQLLSKPLVKLELYPFKIKEQFGKIEKLAALVEKLGDNKISVRADTEQILSIKRVINSYKSLALTGSNGGSDSVLQDLSLVSRTAKCHVCKGTSGDSHIVELVCGHIFCLYHLEEYIKDCDPLSPLECTGVSTRDPSDAELFEISVPVQIVYEHLVEVQPGSPLTPAFIRKLNSALDFMGACRHSYNALDVIGIFSSFKSSDALYEDRFELLSDFEIRSPAICDAIRKLVRIPTNRIPQPKHVIIEPVLLSSKRDVINLFNLEKFYLSLVHVIGTLSQALHRLEKLSQHKQILEHSELVHGYCSAIPPNIGAFVRHIESVLASLDWMGDDDDDVVLEQLSILDSPGQGINRRLNGIIPDKFPCLKAFETLYLAHFDSFPQLPPSDVFSFLTKGEVCGQKILYEDLASHVRGKTMRSCTSERLEAYCKNLESFTVSTYENVFTEDNNPTICKPRICFIKPYMNMSNSPRRSAAESRGSSSSSLVMEVDFPKRLSYPFSDPGDTMTAGLYETDVLKGSISLLDFLKQSDDANITDSCVSRIYALMLSILKLGGSFSELRIADCLYFYEGQQLWIPNKFAIQAGVSYSLSQVQAKLKHSNQISPQMLLEIVEDIPIEISEEDITCWKFSKRHMSLQSAHLFGSFMNQILQVGVPLTESMRFSYSKRAYELLSNACELGNRFVTLAPNIKPLTPEARTHPIQLRITYWLFEHEILPEDYTTSLIGGNCFFPEKLDCIRSFEFGYQTFDQNSLPVEKIRCLCQNIRNLKKRNRKQKHWSSGICFPSMVHDFTKTQYVLPEDVRAYLHGDELQSLLFFVYDANQSSSSQEVDTNNIHDHCQKIIWRICKLQQFLISSGISHPLLYDKLFIEGEKILVKGCETLSSIPNETAHSGQCVSVSVGDELADLAPFVENFLRDAYAPMEPSVRFSAIIPLLRKCTYKALEDVIRCLSEEENDTEYEYDANISSLLSTPTSRKDNGLSFSVKSMWEHHHDVGDFELSAPPNMICFQVGSLNF